MTPTKVLFVHNNFPAQYGQLANVLAQDDRYRVMALGTPSARPLDGVTLFRYALPPEIAAERHIHPFAQRFEVECWRAEQIMYLANHIRAEGLSPDIVFVHPGWGESLPLRVLFPKAAICVYCEFFYRTRGADVGFDPEFPELGLDGLVKVSLGNASTLLALAEADIGLSPTQWQKSTYPVGFADKIGVIHDGVDTGTARPDPAATVTPPDSRRVFRSGDEVVTYVARNLEPYRGIHTFVRSWPKLLRDRPNAHIFVVGGNDVSYGPRAPDGKAWIDLFLQEIKGQVDLSRVHFFGRVTRQIYLNILQVSAVHVYLTYPFVLSWSALEAMACGCLVIGSDTEPVREVLADGETGLLTPFFSADALAAKMVDVLHNKERFASMRGRARDFVKSNYDFKDVTLPRLRNILSEFEGRRER
jgi:glycosyltransferase involved in cell wall biosynthesis